MDNYNKYALDKEIPDTLWKKYLNKYSKTYKLQKGQDGTIEIKCKRGKIQPYSIIQRKLLFWGNYTSIRAKNNFFKRLDAIYPLGYKKTQEGDTEFVIVFDEKNLEDLASIIEAKKRRILSDKQLETLAKNRKPFKKQNPIPERL